MIRSSSDLLKAKKSHLEDFLEQTKRANRAVPDVKRALEMTDLNLDVIKNAPLQAKNVFETPSIRNVLREDLEISLKNLPINKIDPFAVKTLVSGASGTASEVVFNAVLSTSDIIEPSIQNWFRSVRDQYFEIQKKQDHEGETHRKLLILDKPLAGEFLLAAGNYKRTLAGTLLPESSANSMRNVLNHFIGKLTEKARKKPKENVKGGHKAQWFFVADRLTTPGTAENSLLKQKYNDHIDLIKSLTNVSKNTSTDPLFDLENIYSKWLEHLYTSIQLAGY